MEKVLIEKVELPKPFEEYVNSKLENGKRGRKHIVNQLGSLEKCLELLTDVWINNLEIKQISKKYNVGYFQLYRFLGDIIPYKDQIIAYLKYIEEAEPKDFRSLPIIKEWEAKIRRSGHLSQLRHIGFLENICMGEYVSEFKCHPNKFDLAKAQQFIDLYLKKNNVKRVPRHIRSAIRHFLMVAKEINIPRGFGGQYGLSGEKDNFGAYKFVKLTEDQIEKVREYLKDDLEALTFFDWGIESLARARTLALTKMNFTEDNGIVETTLFETKTSTPFSKILLLNIKHCRETWEEIQKLGKGRLYLFFNGDKPTRSLLEAFLSRISKKLKEAYQYARVIEPYAYKKPFHFLRHTGAHLWLMRTNYDYGLVAEMGWEDINTLRQVYGGMPKTVFQQKIASLSQQKIQNGGIS